MKSYNEAIARARELTAGDGKERYVWWDWTTERDGGHRYSSKRPTRKPQRSHAIVRADGTIGVGYGMSAPYMSYGMRPMSVSARSLEDAPGMYLGAIQMTFPECQPHLVETANFVRANGMSEVVRQQGLMQSIYGLASCINRHA